MTSLQEQDRSTAGEAGIEEHAEDSLMPHSTVEHRCLGLKRVWSLRHMEVQRRRELKIPFCSVPHFRNRTSMRK